MSHRACRHRMMFPSSLNALQFVISLWGLNLPSVIKAASTPLRRRKRPLPAPRVLLLKAKTPSASTAAFSRIDKSGAASHRLGFSNDGDKASEEQQLGEEENEDASDASPLVGGMMKGGAVVRTCAIRGIDCVRPSFLSGRKRTSLGIIDEPSPRLRRGDAYWGGASTSKSQNQRMGGSQGREDTVSDCGPVCGVGCTNSGIPGAHCARGGVGDYDKLKEAWWSAGDVREHVDATSATPCVLAERTGSGTGSGTAAGIGAAPHLTAWAAISGNAGGSSSSVRAAAENGVKKRRGKKSGAACRKRRRRCKEARRLKAASMAAALGAGIDRAAAVNLVPADASSVASDAVAGGVA